jgi:hypothetical protein
MGSGSKIAHVLLRVGQLAASAIVLGLLGRFLWIISTAGVFADSRIVYATVVACIGVLFSVFFMVPCIASFFTFPIDFIMAILWLVAFCLFEAVSVFTSSCTIRTLTPAACRHQHMWREMVLELLGLLLGRLLEEAGSCPRT